MGDNVVIGASLQVDASGAQPAGKIIKEMKQDVKDLRTEFENTKAGTAESVAAFNKLKAAEDELQKATKNLGKSAEEGSGRFGKLKEGIASVPGPLNAVAEGGGKVNSIFKTLAANPLLLILTAIVAVLTLLYKAFTNTFEGAEKVEQIFSGIKAAAQALFDNIGHLASALVKFFSFDFSGAVDEIKQVVGAATEAYNKMAELTRQAQELHKEQLKNDLEQAERQKRLAVLRSQTQDEDVPIAQRKAALKELLAASEQNAKEDVDLAKRTTENKIAQLTLQKDGELKNMDEINKLKIDQIRVETENANEIRAIRKQITQATKQELAEQKEAQRKAAEEAKKRREELLEFTNKLRKLQEENDLALLKDSYEKEQKQILNRIAEEKRANNVSLQEKKISAGQLAQLNAELDKAQNLQLDNLRDKHNKDIADKEAAFQKELNTIKGKAAADGLTDQREAERAQLKITYAQQLADAAKNYKDNADHLQQIRTALEEQFHAENQKLEEKFRKEDEKARTDSEIAIQKRIADNQKMSFLIRYEALDQEKVLFQQQLSDKIISESEYNNKVAELADARIKIHEEEKKANERLVDSVGQGFGNLAAIAGKQTAIGKALAIAQASIDTYSSAVKAYNAMADIPVVGPVLGGIAAAAAVAAGIQNVKSIIAVKVPGQASAGSAPSISGAATSAPATPAQISTTFTGTQNATTANASSNRVYVLDSDVRDANERNERLNRAARLGGG